MTNEELIKALKGNEKPFGLMSAEMQEKAGEIGKLQFQLYHGYKTPWRDVSDVTFNHGSAYRLRQDYTEEPEVVKCEVKPDENNQLCYASELRSYGEHFLYTAYMNPDFIGFLYEDGNISTQTRLYHFKDETTGCACQMFKETYMEKVEVLTPTHVLFRGSK